MDTTSTSSSRTARSRQLRRPTWHRGLRSRQHHSVPQLSRRDREALDLLYPTLETIQEQDRAERLRRDGFMGNIADDVPPQPHLAVLMRCEYYEMVAWTSLSLFVTAYVIALVISPIGLNRGRIQISIPGYEPHFKISEIFEARYFCLYLAINFLVIVTTLLHLGLLRGLSSTAWKILFGHISTLLPAVASPALLLAHLLTVPAIHAFLSNWTPTPAVVLGLGFPIFYFWWTLGDSFKAAIFTQFHTIVFASVGLVLALRFERELFCLTVLLHLVAHWTLSLFNVKVNFVDPYALNWITVIYSLMTVLSLATLSPEAHDVWLSRALTLTTNMTIDMIREGKPYPIPPWQNRSHSLSNSKI